MLPNAPHPGPEGCGSHEMIRNTCENWIPPVMQERLVPPCQALLPLIPVIIGRSCIATIDASRACKKKRHLFTHPHALPPIEHPDYSAEAPIEKYPPAATDRPQARRENLQVFNPSILEDIMQKEVTRTEEFVLSGDEVIAKLKNLIHEGTARRVIIKNEEGRTLIEVPLAVGLVGAALMPVFAAIGALAAIAARLTLVIEKVERAEPVEKISGVEVPIN